ncbi:MAG: class I SAM-dependent methyltransferase, partial [Gemmataceae bacterium]
LVYGWGNEGFSAEGELIGSLSEEVGATAGTVLECGSGLTTVVLGVATRGTGRRVIALEHHPEWAERVRGELARHRLDHVRVMDAGLTPLGDYDWYAATKDEIPRDVGLIVCDGPPDTTRGGRFGLLPEMRGWLAGGCVILLDDAQRAGEQDILRRWAAELGVEAKIEGVVKPFGRLVVPGGAS